MTNAIEIAGDKITINFEPKEAYFFAPRNFSDEARDVLGCRSCSGEGMLTLDSTHDLISNFTCRYLILAARAKNPVCETRLKK